MKTPSKKKAKPGPAPTGLKRSIPFLAMFSHDESEYLERLQIDALEAGKKLKAAQIIRQRTFRAGWNKELELMRMRQGPLLAKSSKS